VTAPTLLALSALVLASCSGGGGEDSADGTEAGGDQETVTLKLAHVLSPDGVEHGVLEGIVEQVEEESGGSLVLELYPSGQLGTTEDLMEQASAGEPVISFVDASTLSQFGADDLGILGGPFLFESVEQAQTFAESDTLDELTAPLADANVHVLALNWFDGARHMFGHEAYPTPADLEGVKVRTPPADTWTRTFELLGAVPTPVDATETYGALEQGVVDAAEGPINGTAANGWQEQAQELTLTSHFLLFLGFAMSEDVYQSLTPEQQDVLTNAFMEGGTTATAEHEATTEETLNTFAEEGVTVHEADVTAYQEATQPFYDSYPEGLLESVREAGQG
jgi:TRAP-type C4-dicarboxylate transport system substrate-binding protein